MTSVMGRLPGRTRGWPGCAVLFLIGAALWAVSTYVPSRMPAWGPYEFSWPIWLAVTLSGLWFQRGLSRLAPVDRPGPWRRIAFWAGLALIYGVTQTGFEYLAQRMFFINRLQHVAMHHVGPVLLALSAGGPAILAGAPGWVRRACDSAPATLFMAFVQQPLVAAFLFVGLFWLWLIPPVHFAAMIDPGLYQVMNWSMAVDGILFWALVLDTRVSPPARVGFGVRVVLAVAVMFPQIVLGALISFATEDLFPYYAFCGRYFPDIDALTDQQIGGLVIWIPPAMMSVLALLLVLNNMRRAGADI
ncbi:cytochrome c oxidase assembly protein [Acuticoccus sp. I52.16.1]|uniref:cytochrome c oxidase assembly protein n=1 Tax=Acuticoccus sp. I52.16.1 TaxID=2928472 RepID=UPI001FD3ADF9|nr:cytochrome c oxidase assembly protein [Acuticoccus sp. I52.16.1]UOM37072.1 cytochrome c oxidase assembly protein [Acuticoccus sp. I52.16.1]